MLIFDGFINRNERIHKGHLKYDPSFGYEEKLHSKAGQFGQDNIMDEKEFLK